MEGPGVCVHRIWTSRPTPQEIVLEQDMDQSILSLFESVAGEVREPRSEAAERRLMG